MEGDGKGKYGVGRFCDAEGSAFALAAGCNGAEVYVGDFREALIRPSLPALSS